MKFSGGKAAREETVEDPLRFFRGHFGAVHVWIPSVSGRPGQVFPSRSRWSKAACLSAAWREAIFSPLCWCIMFSIKLKEEKKLWVEYHQPGPFRNAEPELSMLGRKSNRTRETSFSDSCCHCFVPAGHKSCLGRRVASFLKNYNAFSVEAQLLLRTSLSEHILRCYVSDSIRIWNSLTQKIT